MQTHCSFRPFSGGEDEGNVGAGWQETGSFTGGSGEGTFDEDEGPQRTRVGGRREGSGTLTEDTEEAPIDEA